MSNSDPDLNSTATHFISCGALTHDSFLGTLHFYLSYQVMFYKIIVHCLSLSNCRWHVARDPLLDRIKAYYLLFKWLVKTVVNQLRQFRHLRLTYRTPPPNQLSGKGSVMPIMPSNFGNRSQTFETRKKSNDS